MSDRPGWCDSIVVVSLFFTSSSLFSSASTPELEYQSSPVQNGDGAYLKVDVEPSSTEASYSSMGTDQNVPSPTGSSSSGKPSVSPLPRVKSPRKVPHDPPVTPGSRSKKKSPLPRVAMLAQNSAKKPAVEPKKSSPPPFRTGGKATALQDPPKRYTSTRTSSASSVLARDQSRQSSMRSTAGTKSAKFAERPQWGVSHPQTSVTPPTRKTHSRTVTPSSGSRRAIAKPPENIKRALQESKALSTMDSVESKDDSDMQNLKEILQDIKTIKSELGVESETVEKEDDQGGEATAESGAAVSEENGIAAGEAAIENANDDILKEEKSAEENVGEGEPIAVEEECVQEGIPQQTSDDVHHDDGMASAADESKDNQVEDQEKNIVESQEDVDGGDASADDNDDDNKPAVPEADVADNMASLRVEASEKQSTTLEVEPEVKAKQLCSCSIM